MGRPDGLFNRIKEVYRLEGLLPLIKRVLMYLRENFFQRETYYLFEHHIIDRDETEFMPKIDDFTFKILETIQEVDELTRQGFNFKPRATDIRIWLSMGAVAFCVFKSTELVHIGWVVLTKKAKERIEPFPYDVNFLNNEACTGGTWTNPHYRGKGLMGYGYFKRFQFLKEKGRFVSRNVVAVRNIASQRAHAKFHPRIYAKVRYFRFLCWKYWGEEVV
ncbi:hypothetical protein ACFLTP_01190 [Chloroflexota bacterium]